MPMNIFKTLLKNAPNYQDLFDADKREKDLRIFSEALKTDVQFKNGQAEIVYATT